MRIVFCGTADFAVPALHAVAAAHEVLAVVTQPDRPGSRGRPAPRPVSDAAALLELPVLRPERIRAPESVDAILAFDPEALVVAAYGQIIPAALLDAPRFGGINVHGSLLPRWRGAAPVAAAILAGDERTGVSIMRMDVGIDTGPVYATRELPIAPADTAPLLSERLAAHGAGLLLEVLEVVANGTAVATPQDDAQATYAPRLTREDGAVEWAAVTAADADRRVRALQPWPGVTAPLGGRRVRIIAGTVSETPVDGAAPGDIVATAGEEADVATAAGAYRVAYVQPPGGRVMAAAAYLRGRRVA
jgi:methionyl-tRNA formyltransferase